MKRDVLLIYLNTIFLAEDIQIKCTSPCHLETFGINRGYVYLAEIPRTFFSISLVSFGNCIYQIFLQKGDLYVHPKPVAKPATLGMVYVVPLLRESVCQKDKEKNRRSWTDLLNGGALLEAPMSRNICGILCFLPAHCVSIFP